MKPTLLCLSILISTAISNAQGYRIGDTAEDFSLKNVDGTMQSLSNYQNVKGYIIIFTCNHCPYAVKYEDRIIELHRQMKPKGWPVIAINPNNPQTVPEDSFQEMQKRAKQKSYPFAYLFDEGQKIYPKYGATRTPQVFLLDKKRTVRYIGAIDDNYADPNAVKHRYVINAIRAIENGQKPNPEITKAIGCSIKT